MISENSRQKSIAVLLGILFMIVAIVSQSIVQDLPAIIMIYLNVGVAKSVKIITEFASANMILYSLFIGGTAAAFQESFKYIAVDTRKKALALWIGLGFSAVDICILYLESYSSLQAITSIFSLLLLLVMLNTISSLLFHPGTAMFLKAGILKGKGIVYLLFAIFLHGIEDGGLVFTDLFVSKSPGMYFVAIGIFWSAVMIISVFIYFYGRSKIVATSEEKKENIVVY